MAGLCGQGSAEARVNLEDPVCDATWNYLIETARENEKRMCAALDIGIAKLADVGTLKQAARDVCLGCLTRNTRPDSEKVELLAGVKGRLVPYPLAFLRKEALGGMSQGLLGEALLGAVGPVFQ